MSSTIDQVRRHLVGLKMPRAIEVLDHIMRRNFTDFCERAGAAA